MVQVELRHVHFPAVPPDIGPAVRAFLARQRRRHPAASAGAAGSGARQSSWGEGGEGGGSGGDGSSDALDSDLERSPDRI